MTLNELLALGARIIQAALTAGAAIPSVIAIAKKMQEWAEAGAQPTRDDIDFINAIAAPYLAMLDDTSRDDPEV